MISCSIFFFCIEKDTEERSRWVNLKLHRFASGMHTQPLLFPQKSPLHSTTSYGVKSCLQVEKSPLLHRCAEILVILFQRELFIAESGHWLIFLSIINSDLQQHSKGSDRSLSEPNLEMPRTEFRGICMQNTHALSLSHYYPSSHQGSNSGSGTA